MGNAFFALRASPGTAIGQVRKPVAARRVVLSQPPHYGRIGAQPEHAKPCPVTAAVLRAVDAAQFERQRQTIKHGARAVVR